jgi:hypothetical protein
MAMTINYAERQPPTFIVHPERKPFLTLIHTFICDNLLVEGHVEEREIQSVEPLILAVGE